MASVVELRQSAKRPIEVVSTVQALRDRVRAARREGARVGFVPTMGFLHEGHLSLMRSARRENDLVIVSIFVNPTQFGPTEDLDAYPRDLQGDVELASEAGVDVVFAPTVREMYPDGVDSNATWVEVHGLTSGLCGRQRPGHFRGVTTIVSKLFLMVQPDSAYFGQKDYQQLAVVRQMVRDMAFPVRIVGLPTVREADGLAMSSRNANLSEWARGDALCLVAALRATRAAYRAGERRADHLLRVAYSEVEQVAGAEVDYVELVHADSLAPYEGVVDGPAVMALAVRIGGVRLIDNALLEGEGF